jgi:hypothetical protein
MNSIWSNRVSAQILDCFHSVSLVANCNLVRLHHFLNGFTNVAESYIDTSLLDAFIGCLLHSQQQIVVDWIECHSESAVDNMSVDLSSKIDFHHIIILEHCLITRVGGVVSSAVVDTAASREGNTLLDSIRFNQPPVCVFYCFADVNKLHPRPNHFLGHFADLAVALSSFTQVIHLGRSEFVFFAILSLGCSHSVEVSWVVHPLSLREDGVRELLGNRDGVVDGLLPLSYSFT